MPKPKAIQLATTAPSHAARQAIGEPIANPMVTGMELQNRSTTLVRKGEARPVIGFREAPNFC